MLLKLRLGDRYDIAGEITDLMLVQRKPSTSDPIFTRYASQSDHFNPAILRSVSNFKAGTSDLALPRYAQAQLRASFYFLAYSILQIRSPMIWFTYSTISFSYWD